MQRPKHGGSLDARMTLICLPVGNQVYHRLGSQGGCPYRDLAINLDEGGMPWTCLPGEPANVNWCNGAGGADLYRHPPAAWRGARTQGRAPSG